MHVGRYKVGESANWCIETLEHIPSNDCDCSGAMLTLSCYSSSFVIVTKVADRTFWNYFLEMEEKGFNCALEFIDSAPHFQF